MPSVAARELDPEADEGVPDRGLAGFHAAPHQRRVDVRKLDGRLLGDELAQEILVVVELRPVTGLALGDGTGLAPDSTQRLA